MVTDRDSLRWLERKERPMMLIARRACLMMIGATVAAACGGAPEPARPPVPQTVTLVVEGMT